MGLMKHQPSKTYVGGMVDYFDYVEAKNLNLADLKQMAVMCGYMNDSEIFWHKFGKFSDRWRLVSTEVETLSIKKFISYDSVVELYFEHLDSYIEVDSDSENELSGDDVILERHGQKKQSFEDGRKLINDKVLRKLSNEDGDSDCVDSEDQKSLNGDSHNECFHFPKHNPKTEAKHPILALEYTFGSREEFKNAVSIHEVKVGKSIRWINNDGKRAKAKCINLDCKWVIMALVMHPDKAFHNKTYDSKHTHKRWNHRNKTITSSFIARMYLDAISQNREWKRSDFRDTVSVGLKAHVTLAQARKAKKKTLALIDGDVKEQFSILWDYCFEIGRSNPGNSMYMKLTQNEMPNKPYRFQRIYVCFAACKEGLKAGCRKILGLDGCWLKGQMYGYQLLTAVGLDANNNIFPVAYAVVEKETRETWSWFLTYLIDDLEINDQADWTFMSDKQKDLIEAFNEVLPSISHRFCVRHLHNNFKRTGFSGSSLKCALWAAASATTVEFFNARINNIVKLDVEAVVWLKEKEPTEWSKSHFSPNAKCDILLNNMCELFNSMILDARD
ncbi:hypothetical protein KY290_025246 [Solanum tuberosum]|uniref:Mutator-like transposase n=1 Tax=Solanum tuberosum TaxID=4113 RepID=A0ABQ7UT48_SOLTU|nr:hypothetical protein KY284_024051 [Solanum tuberosum]KAH0754976.1 hypothetical protein KY290_025246 [Solanum tuberosum]